MHRHNKSRRIDIMRNAAAIANLFAALAIAPAAGAATPGITGQWLSQDRKGVVSIEPCAGKLCGRITWLRAPLDSAGKPKHDAHNPQARLQSRPICGLPILWNFTQEGPDSWTGGEIYDPEKGETYHCNIHLEADGTLHVRGYVGISLLGRTEVWTRPPSTLPQCQA
jgi:uncharacterized protein (DUF2147 family)